MTIPSGYEWTNVAVQCWGGGGGGGASYQGNLGQGYVYYSGGGGDGGAYSFKTYATPLLAGTFSYYVASGGSGGSYVAPGGNNQNGGGGGDTIWNYLSGLRTPLLVGAQAATTTTSAASPAAGAAPALLQNTFLYWRGVLSALRTCFRPTQAGAYKLWFLTRRYELTDGSRSL